MAEFDVIVCLLRLIVELNCIILLRRWILTVKRFVLLLKHEAASVWFVSTESLVADAPQAVT